MTSKLKFRNLPLIEVSMRRIFSRPASMSLSSLPAILAAAEGQGLGELSDLPALENLAAPYGHHEFEFLSLPGFAFLNDALGISMHVQFNGIISKWQQLPGIDYPGHVALNESMNALAAALKESGTELPGVFAIQLVYQSRIGKKFLENGNPADWLFSFTWPEVAGESVGSLGELQLVFKGVSGVDKRLSLHERMDESGDSYYLLQTVAGMRLPDGKGLEEGENDLHEALTNWFPRVLSSDAKTLFGFDQE